MNIPNKDEEVKNQILEAAKRVFGKWGLNKTTMEDIAHEAEKGKSTIYYYYKSKDEIFEILVISEMRNIINRAKTLVSKERSAKDKLKKYITLVLNDIKTTTSIYPLVRGEIKGKREVIDKLRKKIDIIEEAVIAEILKDGLSSGEFNFLQENQVEKAANVISGIIWGLELYLFLDNDDSEKIDMVTRIISEGI